MVKGKGITSNQARAIRREKGLTETKLQKIRFNRGLAQRELAEKIGVSLRTIQEYEQDTEKINNARFGVLCKLCTVLGCKIDDILEDKETIETYRKVK